MSREVKDHLGRGGEVNKNREISFHKINTETKKGVLILAFQYVDNLFSFEQGLLYLIVKII